MIYRCPNCNGALEYNPVTDEMECAHCGGSYTMQEIEAGSQKAQDYYQQQTAYSPWGSNDSAQTWGDNTFSQPWGSVQTASPVKESDDYIEENNIYAEPETMECKIYTCTSCGAELAVNDTEVSTYCAYCGQPTIVYSRVSQEKKPRYIIPFKISKEEALGRIRANLGKGVLIPKEIKNFDVEKMRGIYVPYFLFDAYYYDKIRVRVGEGIGKDKKTVTYRFEADCEFEKISCDASKRLNDESTQRLEPYQLEELRDFDAAYLSGFYADRYDLTARQLTNVVVKRCQELFDEEVKMQFHDLQAAVMERKPKHVIRKSEYALLPVWFMTFRYKNEPYTMLVNGQTGKVVGAVPVNKGLAVGLFASVSALVSVIIATLGLVTWYGTGETMDFRVFVFLYVLALIFYLIGISCISVCRKNMKLTKLVKTAKFVGERQDDI